MRAPRTSAWPDHRTLWRWHFYAGLICIPFVVMLSCTGLIYLFKPQIDDLIDHRYEHLAAPLYPASPAAEARAALAAFPGARLLAYELPRTDRSAARVVILRGSEAIRVYVDPGRLIVLKQVPEEQRFERIVFNLHGQLLLGNRGSLVVETVASWAIVMLLTGLCLWWPRPVSGRSRLAGLLYPRLRAGGRVVWRDLHAVIGLWVSAFALFLLVSGLPWAYAWGSYLAEWRTLSSPAVAASGWEIGHVPARIAIAGAPAAMAMPDMPEMTHPALRPVPLDALDSVAAAVAPLHLAYPVLLTPPASGHAVWHARSDAQNRTLRTTLTVSSDGRILSRVDFGHHPVLDRVIGVGVAAHEGQLFGWTNQLLGALTALSLILVSVSAVVIWVRRRPVGRLGAPPALAARPVAGGFLAVLGVLAVALPMLGTSMLGVFLFERLVLRRMPRMRDWLGLSPCRGARTASARPPGNH